MCRDVGESEPAAVGTGEPLALERPSEPGRTETRLRFSGRGCGFDPFHCPLPFCFWLGPGPSPCPRGGGSPPSRRLRAGESGHSSELNELDSCWSLKGAALLSLLRAPRGGRSVPCRASQATAARSRRGKPKRRRMVAAAAPRPGGGKIQCDVCRNIMMGGYSTLAHHPLARSPHPNCTTSQAAGACVRLHRAIFDRRTSGPL